MDSNPNRPKVKSDNSIVLPLIAAVAITIALAFGWGMMTSKSDQQAANPASQSSSTGGSGGESGQSTVSSDPNMKANPGAAAAPTKAPNSDPSAADTQPQPKP